VQDAIGAEGVDQVTKRRRIMDDRVDVNLREIAVERVDGAAGLRFLAHVVTVPPAAVDPRYVAAGMGEAKFQAGKAVEHATEYQAGDGHRGLQRITDQISEVVSAEPRLEAGLVGGARRRMDKDEDAQRLGNAPEGVELLLLEVLAGDAGRDLHRTEAELRDRPLELPGRIGRRLQRHLRRGGDLVRRCSDILRKSLVEGAGAPDRLVLFRLVLHDPRRHRLAIDVDAGSGHVLLPRCLVGAAWPEVDDRPIRQRDLFDAFDLPRVLVGLALSRRGTAQHVAIPRALVPDALDEAFGNGVVVDVDDRRHGMLPCSCVSGKVIGATHPQRVTDCRCPA
jgi:hypothetical protein